MQTGSLGDGNGLILYRTEPERTPDLLAPESLGPIKGAPTMHVDPAQLSLRNLFLGELIDEFKGTEIHRIAYGLLKSSAAECIDHCLRNGEIVSKGGEPIDPLLLLPHELLPQAWSNGWEVLAVALEKGGHVAQAAQARSFKAAGLSPAKGSNGAATVQTPPDSAGMPAASEPASTAMQDSQADENAMPTWHRPNLPPKVVAFFKALEHLGGNASAKEVSDELDGYEPSRLWTDYPNWKAHLELHCKREKRLYSLQNPKVHSEPVIRQ